MGRLTYLILAVLALNMALLLFTCEDFDKEGHCIVTNETYSYMYNSTEPNSTAVNFFYNTQKYDQTDFWKLLIGESGGIIAALGGMTLIVGSLIFRTDIMFYFGIMLSMIYSVQTFIKYTVFISGSGMFSPMTMWILGLLFGAPLVVIFVLTMIEWGGNR